jgi:hypothetical protein
VICVGTSATVSDESDELNGEAATRQFAHRLFGVPEERIQFITEHYRPIQEPEGLYAPPSIEDAHALLDAILEAAIEVHRQDEPEEAPSELLSLAEQLCGRPAPPGDTTNQRMYDLLAGNRLARRLERLLHDPRLLDDILPALGDLNGRATQDREDSLAEVLAVLTLGALAERDGEPLLRPKLHYFVQGYQGLYFSFEDRDQLQLHFDRDQGQHETSSLLFPLLLCRSCGQHYTQVIAEVELVEQVDGDLVSYRPVEAPEGFDRPGENQRLVFLTDRLHTHQDDEEEAPGMTAFLCRFCGTLHPNGSSHCMNPKCQAGEPLIRVLYWEDELKRCAACGGMNWGHTRLVTATRSAEVADVTILSQSMLAAMPEPKLQKLLIFADNRQDAAFQAGWMEERSKRFRMRHLLYQILNQDPERIWGYDGLVEELLAEAQSALLVPSGGWDDKNERLRVRWFLLEEFASLRQRRSSLEQLGLAEARYKDLTVEMDPDFFEHWATVFDCPAEQVVNLTRLLLDHYRRRGLLSDPLLSRYWSPMDREVREGLVATADYYRPEALVREGASSSPYKKGWLAPNGRSAAQVMVKNAVPRSQDLADNFLVELWAWFIKHDYLAPVELVRRRYGRIEPILEAGDIYQVNADRLGITETDTRLVCNYCGRAFSVSTPTGKCPGYLCDGQLEPAPRDDDHYDVVQYTRLSFVPMRPHEHSGQVPKNTREDVEREFKKEDGRFNTIVATPTLELGVDIGMLEMVLMRNVPPAPSNYAQRSGRAGRRHRIAVVFTHARGAQHDRYFFSNPPEMIAGAIRVPTFSMRNDPLIRKHIHSAALTALRELARPEETEILSAAFPEYIWRYFGEWVTDAGGQNRFRYLDSSPKFPDLDHLVHRHRDQILARLDRIFTQTWPVPESEAVTSQQLEGYLDSMVHQLEAHMRNLFAEIQRYRQMLEGYRQRQQAGYELSDEEESQRRRFQHALRTYRQETLENWTLGYLSNTGFLPGYALSRANVLAQSLQPFLILSRPAAIALRELTPGSNVYANKNVFQVQTLNFYKLRALDSEWTPEMLRRQLRFDPEHERVYDPAKQQREGGELAAVDFESYELTDVEMDLLQEIDDRREYRQRMAYDIYGMLQDQHEGGTSGRVGDRRYFYLRQENVRLVNMGPTYAGPASPQGIGFPICPHCGETRSPVASTAEIDSFREGHQKRCQVPDIVWTAIHVDLKSDILRVGPYPTKEEAINVFEGLRIGARMVLDMGENEVEGFALPDEDGSYWAVLYDPLPGGSGFLPEILNYWKPVCQRAIEVLESCTCERACYKCMKHFRNQQFHEDYDRHLAVELLDSLMTEPVSEHEIPHKFGEPKPGDQYHVGKADSPAEEDFIKLLQLRQFPEPDKAQYAIDLGNGETTIADFAYTDAKVLVFIDGLSNPIHGNPAQSRKDRIKRAKAKMLGYNVVEIPAAALRDETMMSAFLDELAVYLEEF